MEPIKEEMIVHYDCDIHPIPNAHDEPDAWIGW